MAFCLKCTCRVKLCLFQNAKWLHLCFCSDEREPIRLVPILCRMDMKIVAAPAIVYISQRKDIQPVPKVK